MEENKQDAGDRKENSDSQKENSDSQKQNSDSQMLNSDSQMQNSESQEQNSDFRKQNSESQKQNSDSQIQNSDSQKQNSDSQIQNSESQKQNSDFQIQNSESQKQNSDSQMQNSDFRKENSDSQIQNSESQKQNSDFQIQNSESQKQNSDSQMQNSDFRKENSDSQIQNSESQKQNSDSQIQNSESQKQNSGNKRDVKIVQKIFMGSTGVMPHAAPELEVAVLGAILIEGQAARRYIPLIHPDYFYEPAHKLIFNACLALQKKDLQIDILTVAQQLREEGMLDTVGGAYRIAEISGRVASSAHLEQHIDILSQFYMRRRLREILLSGDNRAADETIDIEETLVEVLRQVNDLSNHLPAINELREMPEVMERVMERLEQRMNRAEGELPGIDTGFAPLNEMLQGWPGGTLNVIGGRPNEGKTAILMYTLLTAVRQGVPVCLISMESSANKLVERWILSLTDIKPDNWNRGRLTDAELTLVREMRKTMEQMDIRFFDRGNITMEEVAVVVKALHAEGKCRLLGVDYLQLFATTRTTGTREQDVAANNQLLKLLSMQLDIPVIALSQLNREVMSNFDKMPHLENIRESGSIEQDADTVSFIFHPHKAGMRVVPDSQYPVTPDMMLLIVAKNRNGACGTIYLSHNPSMTKFAEYAPSAEWLQRASHSASEGPAAENDWRTHDRAFQAFLRAEEEKTKNNGKLPF